MGAGSDHDVPVVDRFDLLRQAMGSVHWLIFNASVAVRASCLTRVHKLDALFDKAGMARRVHVLKNIEFVGSVGSI